MQASCFAAIELAKQDLYELRTTNCKLIMMPVLGFQEAVEKILLNDQRYRTDAYFFLRDVLDFTIKRRKKQQKQRKEGSSLHVTSSELLEGFRLQTLKEFGPMSVTVLDYWGVKSGSDIGQIIFNLIEAGVLGKTENDTLTSFSNAFDFEKVFVLPFQPAVPSVLEASLTL